MTSPINELKEKYFDNAIKRLEFYKDENLKMRDEFAMEKTYKFSNLLISLDVGIFGAMSFLFLREEGHSLPFQLFVLILVFPIVSIIFEIIYKNKVLEANRAIADERAEFIPKFIRQDVLKVISRAHHDIGKFEKDIEELNNTEKEGFRKIFEENITKKQKQWDWLRRWSLRLLIATLIGVAIFTIITGLIFPPDVDRLNNPTQPHEPIPKNE